MSQKPKRISLPNEHFFFGYYNVPQWNISKSKVLACRAQFIDKHPKKDDLLDIGYFENNKFVRIDSTNSWNWQQGCMLQWLPNSDNEIIYNKRENGRFISIIYNTNTKTQKKIPFPIYSIHPSGEYALSLNFSRLNNIRKGYGYEGVKDIFHGDRIPKKDGIYMINIKTKKVKLIISIENLSKKIPEDSMKYGKHWVNHIEFSPSGDKFCFFYRWELPSKLFNTRLITSSFDGKDFKILANGGEISHVDWISDRKLIGWGSSSKYIKKIKSNIKATKLFFEKIRPILKKILPKKIRNKITKQGYLEFDDDNDKINKINIFNEDGHPSISPNGKLILTDTYASKNHFRKLLIFNIISKKRIVLGKFYSLPDKKYSNDKNWDNSGLRCDLHPRWNTDGKKICFDSVHEGFRGIYEIEI